MSCELCCTECKGWCHSFTRTERALTLLEAVLLVFTVSLSIFLILHLLACSTLEIKLEEHEEIKELPEDVYEETKHAITTKWPTTTRSRKTLTSSLLRVTVEPGLECSWSPSTKTTAFTHYYENMSSLTGFEKDIYYATAKLEVTTTRAQIMKLDAKSKYNADFIQVDQSDGEDADPLQNKYILSLVKLKPPQGVVFGCILTIISEYWMLTSASCIEAIEEIDSLDSFVIMEEYGTLSKGKIHSMLDVQIHPSYRGVDKSYDLAAVKSASGLEKGRAAELPTAWDSSMITIGERLHVLGFGAYRSIDASERGRRLRRVFVYVVSQAQCAGAAWAARHLEAGRGLARGAPARGRCAGPLYARALPCNYCAGSPLVRGARLLALMADSPQCGAACEPQLYVDLAALRDWIDAIVDAQ